MFEGWISELLAGYLGHFLDVKREQLRVSLWNGELTHQLFLPAIPAAGGRHPVLARTACPSDCAECRSWSRLYR